MRAMLITVCFILVSQFVFSQRVTRDPSYSVNNYKHPNKAEYAKKNNLDNSVLLESIIIKSNDNYKAPHNVFTNIKKHEVKRNVSTQQGRSYKHPYGL